MTAGHPRLRSPCTTLGTDEQGTAGWDGGLIEEGERLPHSAYRPDRPGRFQLEAAIQSVHCARRVTGRTDGPAAGLALLDTLTGPAQRFQPAWATRAHLLARTGDRTAVTLTTHPAPRRHLLALRDRLTSP